MTVYNLVKKVENSCPVAELINNSKADFTPEIV